MSELSEKLIDYGGLEHFRDTLLNNSDTTSTSTWSSSKINEEIQAVGGTADSEFDGKTTEDFRFVTELPKEATEGEQVVIKGENVDTLYKYVSGAWAEQTPDANILYFDTENEALYSYVSAEKQFATISSVNTIVVGKNLNTSEALKAIKTPGTYSVLQRTSSTTKGEYTKKWTLTVEGVDYDEYELTDSVYQRIQSNFTIQKRTWSSTRTTNDGWTNFSTYYAGEIKDTTTSKYYTWSSSKINSEIEAHIEPDYLSFKNVGSNTVYVTFNAGNTTATGQFPVETGQYSVFQYSMNKKTWTNLTEGYIELNAGEVVYFRGILSGIETLTSSKAATFKTYTDATLSTFVSSGCLEVDGDLRSMVDYTGINDDIVPFRGCTRLFNNNAAILNTPKMTSSILKDFAYDSIFYNCVNLTYVKTFEFKTLVGQAQCNRMFQDCSSLTTAPELPSTQLAKRCYSNMFSGCINLKQAPELPSLLVPYDAYDYMFNGCTSLTIPPSTLPAMTIGDYAYYGMFKGCTSLKYTPDILVLSADNTNADDEIYYGSNHGRKMESMFDGCTSLSTIKLHNLRFFTSTNCVNKITNNVAANGTMYIASGSRTAWEAMAQGSGIPTGWTIIEI